ncbi:MAG TPA: CRISPR-associated protein Cas2 [Candidatus Paceibacterota bacterium]|nr:CRISPR-associated protein Cas2 [Candidatus Paceibacterota bacterium]
MKTFLISYDLGVPETHSDYVLLSNHIKSFYSSWARPVKSVWILKSEKDTVQIRDEIKSVLDSNDKLIVVEMSGDWGTYNISKEITDWMKNNI